VEEDAVTAHAAGAAETLRGGGIVSRGGHRLPLSAGPASAGAGVTLEGEEAGDVNGVTEGRGVGEGAGIGDGAGDDSVGDGVAVALGTGRNSVCRIRPPASAVQMLSVMERSAPIMTAQPITPASWGNLMRASRAITARRPVA
jgi:hypothetical protein